MNKIIKFNCDCGFEWEKGFSGQHNCSPFYRETIDGQQQEIAKLEQALKLNDDEIANSEAIKTSIAVLTDAKINEQQQEIAELKSTNDNLFLNVSSLKSQADRQVKMYNDQVDEIAELKARVNLLRQAVDLCLGGIVIEDVSEIESIIYLSPAQCLQSVKADAVKKQWIPVHNEPENDTIVIGCCDDDVFECLHHYEGLFYDMNSARVKVEYWMLKPDSFYQMKDRANKLREGKS